MTEYNNGMVHIKDIMQSTCKSVDSIANKKNSLSTGLSALDRVLNGGLRCADLICVAARPGMGKTAFVLGIAADAARSKKVCIFSDVQSSEWMTKRMLAREGLIDSYKLLYYSDLLTDDDWTKITEASARLSERDILIDDTYIDSADDIEEKINGIDNIGLIVVDYAHYFVGVGVKSYEWQREFVRSLKLLAKKLNVPVIFTSPLSRAPEERGDHRPLLCDLRPQIAGQDSDVVMFLYRDSYYNSDMPEEIADIIVAKNRNGGTGPVEVGWLGQYGKFVTLDKE